MKLLYLVNLFIVCSSAFTIQSSNSLMLKSNLNICRCHSFHPSNNFYKTYQPLKKSNNNFLKKYDNDDNNNDDKKDDNIQLLNITILLLASLKIIILLFKDIYL